MIIQTWDRIKPEFSVLLFYLDLVVLPVGERQGLDLVDVENVAVNPGTVQTNEHPQGAGTPTRIYRGGRRENTFRGHIKIAQLYVQSGPQLFGWWRNYQPPEWIWIITVVMRMKCRSQDFPKWWHLMKSSFWILWLKIHCSQWLNVMTAITKFWVSSLDMLSQGSLWVSLPSVLSSVTDKADLWDEALNYTIEENSLSLPSEAFAWAWRFFIHLHCKVPSYPFCSVWWNVSRWLRSIRVCRCHTVSYHLNHFPLHGPIWRQHQQEPQLASTVNLAHNLHRYSGQIDEKIHKKIIPVMKNRETAQAMSLLKLMWLS